MPTKRPSRRPTQSTRTPTSGVPTIAAAADPQAFSLTGTLTSVINSPFYMAIAFASLCFLCLFCCLCCRCRARRKEEALRRRLQRHEAQQERQQEQRRRSAPNQNARAVDGGAVRAPPSPDPNLVYVAPPASQSHFDGPRYYPVSEPSYIRPPEIELQGPLSHPEYDPPSYNFRSSIESGDGYAPPSTHFPHFEHPPVSQPVSFMQPLVIPPGQVLAPFPFSGSPAFAQPPVQPYPQPFPEQFQPANPSFPPSDSARLEAARAQAAALDLAIAQAEDQARVHEAALAALEAQAVDAHSPPVLAVAHLAGIQSAAPPVQMTFTPLIPSFVASSHAVSSCSSSSSIFIPSPILPSSPSFAIEGDAELVSNQASVEAHEQKQIDSSRHFASGLVPSCAIIEPGGELSLAGAPRNDSFRDFDVAG